MNKEQLLEEAKRRYPVGTKYRLAHDNSRIHYNTTLNFKWGNNDNIYQKEGDSGKNIGGCIYASGKWAEVISYPENYKPISKLFPIY